MNYSVLEKKLDIGKEFKGFLTQIFDEKLDCIMEAIHKRQFWCDDLSLNYLGTIEDKRKIIEPKLFNIIRASSKNFLRVLLESFDLKSKEIHIFLPRLLVTMPYDLIPKELLKSDLLVKSGFLNPFVEKEYSYFSFFSDHPPHIDLIDYKDLDSHKRVYTCLIPLTSSINQNNGGLYLSKDEWPYFPDMSFKRCENLQANNWKSFFIDQFQPIAWNQYQPHTLGYNKNVNMTGFFRFCFCHDLNNKPILRSPFISINL
tara:strand:+ start:1550 stop:2323 length:774 start_codon:yes stop_codon:yes gene_type:complete